MPKRGDNPKMDTQTLRPRRDRIEIKGKLSYRESYQAWNTIRFKKELIFQFPQLKEKNSVFSYRLVFYQEYQDLEKAIRKMRKFGEAVPILLWLVKEKLE